jgi:hypothetical protein
MPGRGLEPEAMRGRSHSAKGARAGDARRSRQAGPAAILALQRSAGNRAIRRMLQREVVTTTYVPMVRFTIGTEITAEFASAAWAATTRGALNDAGVQTLRDLALQEHGTIDDDERMFIAVLLDTRSAERLHFLFPSGFATRDEEIEFPVSWIPPQSRSKVRDFGRTSVPATPAPSGRRRSAAAQLDDAIIAMAGAFSGSVRKTLALADQARIAHAQVHAAMLAAASDSTPGDRAMAGAVYVIAKRAGMSLADDLLAGRIKVDEVSPSYIGAGVAATYQTGGKGRKGDTMYVPSDLDVEDLDQQGTVVHELTHAADDKAATSVTQGPADRMELGAFRAQARFYLRSLAAMGEPARGAALAKVAAHAGPVRIYTMLMEANVAPVEDYDDQLAIIEEINNAAGALGARAWRTAVDASNADLERLALPAIRRLERLRPGQMGQNEGLSGESILDWRFR